MLLKPENILIITYVCGLHQIDSALEEGVEILKAVVTKGLTEAARSCNTEQKYKHLRFQNLPVWLSTPIPALLGFFSISQMKYDSLGIMHCRLKPLVSKLLGRTNSLVLHKYALILTHVDCTELNEHNMAYYFLLIWRLFLYFFDTLVSNPFTFTLIEKDASK